MKKTAIVSYFIENWTWFHKKRSKGFLYFIRITTSWKKMWTKSGSYNVIQLSEVFYFWKWHISHAKWKLSKGSCCVQRTSRAVLVAFLKIPENCRCAAMTEVLNEKKFIIICYFHYYKSVWTNPTTQSNWNTVQEAFHHPSTFIWFIFFLFFRPKWNPHLCQSPKFRIQSVHKRLFRFPFYV